jgi:hypothetical protein
VSVLLRVLVYGCAGVVVSMILSRNN